MKDLKTRRLMIALNNFQKSVEKRKVEDDKKINNKEDFESLVRFISYVGLPSKDILLAKISKLLSKTNSIKEIVWFFIALNERFNEDEPMRIEDFEEILIMLEHKAVELIRNVDIASSEEVYYDFVETLERFGKDHEIENLICNEAIPEPVIHAFLSKIKEIQKGI